MRAPLPAAAPAAVRVQISLAPDLKRTVRAVLEKCRLPTTYLDSLPPDKRAPRPGERPPRRRSHPLDDLFGDAGVERPPPTRAELTLL